MIRRSQDRQCDEIANHLLSRGDKPLFVFLAPGPKYYLSQSFRKRCELLSRDYYGCVITGSSKQRSEKFGDFLVYALDMKKYGNLALAWQMLSVLRTVRGRLLSKARSIDLVASYDPLLMGILGLVVSHWFGAALVVEVNGCFGNPFNYVDDPSPLKRKLSSFLYPRISEYVFRRADGLKLLFPSQIKYAKRVLSDIPLTAFHEFVELDRFRCIRDDREVLFVGQPLRLKGVDLLIQAFHMIKGEFSDWRLTICGWFPYQRELLKWIDGEQRIVINAPVPYSQMPELIGKCCVFVLPSRCEGMGRVLLEAAAARKARIGARVGGIPTVIRDGFDGLLFERGNARDLADKLRKVMSSPELRMRLGENAHQRVYSELNPESWLESYRTLYKSAIEHRNDIWNKRCRETYK
jgi:glycosyltransferase involved in cell wall biosynthesis